MNVDYLVLASRIKQEVVELRLVIARAVRASGNAQKGGDDSDLYIDAAALNLHDFYTGLERIFQLIAVTVDRSPPTGQEWHRDLLRQMCVDIPAVRPPVLSKETCTVLDEFMRFRHVVRNVYAFQLNGERIGQLVEDGQALIHKIESELETFSIFLTQAGQE